MYNVQTKDALVNEFITNVDNNLNLIKDYGNLAELMQNDNVAMVKHIINESSKLMVASIPEGVNIPYVSVYTSLNGDDKSIQVIDIILRNKYSSKYDFKMKGRLVYSESVFDELINFLKCSYIELLIDSLVRHNLEKVNSKLKEVVDTAGNGFEVRIVSPLNNKGKKIVKLTDNEVVFVADEERALSLDDILIFCEPTEFITEDKIRQGFDYEVSRFAEAQTTVQFIGVHNPLIGYICDISKLVKPFTLIKKVYSKNIAKIRGNKETFAYFHKDNVYSVLFVNNDGIEVALQPFDINSLELVDFDVLQEIQ